MTRITRRCSIAASATPSTTAFRTQTWQEGILSREISEGPRFRLPGRDHVLFRGGGQRLRPRSDWVLDVPWRDRPGEEHGFAAVGAEPERSCGRTTTRGPS